MDFISSRLVDQSILVHPKFWADHSTKSASGASVMLAEAMGRLSDDVSRQ